MAHKGKNYAGRKDLQKADFRRANLRGANFRGADCTGADFTEAQLHSADFSGATLVGANFNGCRTGLQKRWLAVQLGGMVIVSALMGVISFVPGWIVAVLYSDDTLQKAGLSGFMIGLTAALVIACLIVLIKQGFTEAAFKSLVFAFAVAFAVAFAFAGAGAGAGAVAFAVAIAFAIAFAIAIAFAGAVAFAVAIAFAIAVAVANQAQLVSGTISSAVLIIFGVYIARQALKGNQKYKIVRDLAVIISSLGGTRFYQANLNNSNFEKATLKAANFNRANLFHVRFYGAKKLDQARPGQSILADFRVCQLLSGQKTDHIDFVGWNLHEANLADFVFASAANFSRADLSGATFAGATLNQAIFTETNALGTDFTAAQMTGVRLQGFNYDSTTCFRAVESRYVFLLEAPNQDGHQERRPHNPDKNFEPGDFEKFFTESLDVLQNLIRNGIDPIAFRAAVESLQQSEPSFDPASLQSIERKGNDVLITWQVDPTLDKANAEKIFEQGYQQGLAAGRTAAELTAAKETNQQFFALLMGAKNPQTLITVTGEKTEMTTQNHYGSGDNVGGDKVMGDKVMGDKITDSFNQQTLNELIQLVQSAAAPYPQPTVPQKMAIATEVLTEVDRNPALKDRLLSSLKEAGTTAVEKSLEKVTDSVVVSTVVAGLKGFLNP